MAPKRFTAEAGDDWQSITFEGQHRIYKVFQHLWASQYFLVTWPTRRARYSDGQTLQGRSTLPDLSHGPWGTGKVGIMQRLDAVDHSHVWPQRFQFLKHQLQIGFRQEAGDHVQP